MKIIKTAASVILLSSLVAACSQDAAETSASVETAPTAVETAESKDMMQQAGEQAEAAMDNAKEMAAAAENKAGEVMAAAGNEIEAATEAAKEMAEEMPASGDKMKEEIEAAKGALEGLSKP